MGRTEKKNQEERGDGFGGAALVRFKAVSPSVGDSYNRHRAAAWTKKCI